MSFHVVASALFACLPFVLCHTANHPHVPLSYELKQSDLTISSYSELSVMNLRRLFANRGDGMEFMELRKQREDKPQNRRPRPSTTH